jgi:molecular chaperone HtpG
MADTEAHETQGFRVQVDLRSLVELLSHHLYGTADVYLRELLQNAVDALHARQLVDLGYVGHIVVEARGGSQPVLVVEDDGIGLTETEIHDFLSTIGRSAKRDEIGLARSDFLGQFGIGLLSCFLVADEVTVITRSVHPGSTWQWRGRSDGTYEVSQVADRDQPGSTVYLRARTHDAYLLQPDYVRKLATRYAGMLGHLIELQLPTGVESIGGFRPPWSVLDDRGIDEERRAELLEWGERHFEESFLDVVYLHAPTSETVGLAFIAADRRSPGSRQRHKLTLKGMLVSDAIDNMLPDWAFFSRCVLDSSGLHPTASREAIVEDDLLHETREAFGQQLRDWLLSLSSAAPARLRAFVRVHHLSLKALAVHDDELLAAMVDWLPVETSLGTLTLGELSRLPGPIRYTPSLDVFRQLLQVSAAQGVCLVNGGYTYETELLSRLPAVRPEVDVEEIDPDDLVSGLADVAGADQAQAAALTAAGNQALLQFGCEVVVRVFRPRSVPVLLVIDPDAGLRRMTRRTADRVQGFWTDVVEGIEQLAGERNTQLCLNFDSDVVRALAAEPHSERTTAALQLLYVQALLLGHQPLDSRELRLLSSSVLSLIAPEPR